MVLDAVIRSSEYSLTQYCSRAVAPSFRFLLPFLYISPLSATGAQCCLCLQFANPLSPELSACSPAAPPDLGAERPCPLFARWVLLFGCVPVSQQTMSIGALPSVDLVPQTSGHAHGYSRGRGHTRSARWVQPPPSLSLGGSNAVEAGPFDSVDDLNPSYSYSNVPQAQQSWSHHNHDHDHHHHHHPSPSQVAAHEDHIHVSQHADYNPDHNHDYKFTHAVQTEHGLKQM